MTEVLAPTNAVRSRAIGFLVVAVGALLLGLGALVDWVTLSFSDRIDPQGVSETPVPGTDIWEGKVVLGAAVVILVLVLATRIVRPRGRAVAVAITAIALLAAGVAISAAIRADTRFIAGDGLDTFAEALSEDLGVPVSEVRDALEEQVRDALEVDRGIGPWVSTVGGLFAAAGGVMTFRWIRDRDRSAGPVTADQR